MSEGIVVAEVDDLERGERVLTQVKGREIAVFNIDGEFYAYGNWCPHQSGPGCEGNLTGTVEASFDRDTLEVNREWVKDGEVVTCPWHGWAFDVYSGECLSRDGVFLPSYPLTVEDEKIIVDI